MALDAATQAKVTAILTALTGITDDVHNLKAQVAAGASSADINLALDGILAKATSLDAETPGGGTQPGNDL